MKTKHHVTNQQIIKESTLATIILLLATYLISFIPWSEEYGKALHQGFADFDIYDLYYAGKKNLKRDTNIVLVQIDTARKEIADEIELLSHCDPKLIAIDAFLESPSDDD